MTVTSSGPPVSGPPVDGDTRTVAHVPIPARGKRYERIVAVCFVVTILAGVGLFAVYAAGGQNQLEGVLLFLALGGLGMGVILWVRWLMPHVVVDTHQPLAKSSAEDVAAATAELESGEGQIVRRSFLGRLLIAAAGALGLAAIIPVRSLGPNPEGELEHTSWRDGKRVVDEEGRVVTSDQLAVGGTITVFPEGAVGSADSQAVLIRLEPDQIEMPEDRKDWVPEGYLCYSKLCTHVACPVGLFDVTQMELVCPCHRSTFKVSQAGIVVFGPAGRPLPQLPIRIDDTDGTIVARGDFSGPVGPAYWNMPQSESEYE